MADAAITRPVILLLEDEAELSKVICATLEGEFEVFSASTAETASKLLAERKFAALVCDHNLPGRMQGLDFLILAISVQPDAKRILLTGLMTQAMLADCEVKAKLSACFAKPLHIAQLRQALRDAISE